MLDQLRYGFETAYIDGSIVSDESFRPQFLSNNYKEGKKVIASIENELRNCDEFKISVAFITSGGIAPLLQTLEELNERKIPGQILTTNYLNFSEPKALEKLHSLNNLKIKMFDSEAAGKGFHTKGYIFKKEEVYRIIIGSSNMTGDALNTNYEWNTKIVSTAEGEMSKQIIDEFNSLWKSKYSKEYDEFIDEYSERYKIIKHQRDAAKQDEVISVEKYRLQPNSMQVGFIHNLRKIVEAGEDKALLISATGTGKTYASAFGMRELGYKRVLFLVHRGQLAKQSKKSYEKVFNKAVSMGLVGAGEDDYDADYVFATVQTLNRDEHLFQYKPDHFDAICIDEAHHVPANTYQKIMRHFTPKLWLGMTATPDKRDDNIEGRNVYEIFNHQIAYEIRLQQAMEDDLLCPFHYFGITDIQTINDDQSIDFSLLTCDERVRHIVEKANYFGYSGNRVKGLIFCRSIDESNALSAKLNQTINPETGRKYRTIALNGSASEEERASAFERLAADDNDDTDYLDHLDYILSYEILNEGVDIVEVNQVIMLRPTQSPIVFIQQLGRGLRKAEGKEYVVILDFIGNYENNFMIPIALSGDRTYNKDNIRRFLLEGEKVIPGASTIHFDKISRERIFTAIDNANFSDIKLIKENYYNLKNKLGRIPALKDFDEYGEMDVLRIFDNNSLGSYYKFLVKYEKEYTIRLSDEEEKIIEFISKKIANGKRIQELKLFKRIFAYCRGFSNVGLFKGLREDLREYNKELSENQKDNIKNILTNEFLTGSGKKTYEKCVFIKKDNEDYVPSDPFMSALSNENFYAMLDELIDFGISRYERDYNNSYLDTDFVLYKKYTYEDVCRLLNWDKNEVPLNIGGYKYDKKTKTFPIFVVYDKAESISDTIKYEDRFLSKNHLISISKSKRKLDSTDIQNLIHSDELGIEVELFIKKNKSDPEFYYLGTMKPGTHHKEVIRPTTNDSVVEMEWFLNDSVRDDIYDYLTQIAK